MSRVLDFLSGITLSTALHLLGIILLALLVNRFLKILTKLVIKPAANQSRAAQVREQQTATLAGVLYSALSKVVWVVALITALDLFGINPTPALTLAGLASIAIGFGAQNLVRDVITGFYIVLEDQYVVGDTIQVGDTNGRVEHLTLRRTVVRDARGALVTIANGDIRTVANLSRDWSQTFVDVSLAPEIALDQPLAALEAACAEFRADAAWSQAIVDGPRILGVESLGRTATQVRLQARTAPTRQDDVARELRRRIHVELQRRGIPFSTVQRIELVGASEIAAEATSSIAGTDR
ncbi:MAG TPA: mechanosensitive ion channel domain-containing protein [Candidatus Acidoferrum sp.]|nr:mechanosensitive ion channel domain-containing protein [Candidatus Acidoferrum sp.]